MTLAETFLLLVFMIWYAVRPKMPPKVPTSIQVLAKENQDLKNHIAALENELKDIRERLEVWRRFFDLPMPGSGEDVKNLLPKSQAELKKLLFEAGRGKPKCQDDNILLDISLINGTITARVLADCPALRNKLLAQHIDIHSGSTLTNPSQIDALLGEARAFRKGPGQDGDCRFDYHFTYATPEDYYAGRERFEKYFYPAGLTRVKQAQQP